MMPVPPPAVRSTAPDPSSALDPSSTTPLVSLRDSPVNASAQSTQQVAPFSVGLDSSSPDAFIRSVAPYAARVSKATGIPAEVLIGMAANETGYGKYASHNNLFGIKGTGPAGTFSTPTWEDYGNGPVTITDNFRAYHSPAESFIDFANLIETSPRYKGAVGQTTVEGFVSALRAGGYMTDPDYVSKITGITTRYQSVIQQSLADASANGGTSVLTTTTSVTTSTTLSVASASAPNSLVARPSSGVVVPNQFAVGLPTDEAMAACGPVAAVAFAQVYNRNPTPAEAMALAKQSGWTAEGGMNGIANEKRLLDKMQLPSTLEMGANWSHIQSEALQHQPVILATPGHYFVIDGYNPATGQYHVGQSGLVYRNGSEWMTPNQIAGLAGAPSGALFTVHPLAGQQAAAVPGQPRQVLPPDPGLVGSSAAAGQREVLPPLDLGNTPPPPPLPTSPAPAPPPLPTAPVVVAAPAVLPINVPPPISATPPPAPPSSPAAAPPQPVAADVAPPSTPSAPSVPAPVPEPVGPPAQPITLVPEAAPPAITVIPPAATAPQPPPQITVMPPPAVTTFTPLVPPPSTPSPADAVVPPPDTSANVGPDAAPLVPPEDATIIQPAAPPADADTSRPGLNITPGMAIGAVAVGSQTPAQPPVEKPRRRPEDEFDDV